MELHDPDGQVLTQLIHTIPRASNRASHEELYLGRFFSNLLLDKTCNLNLNDHASQLYTFIHIKEISRFADLYCDALL